MEIGALLFGLAIRNCETGTHIAYIEYYLETHDSTTYILHAW